MRVLMTVFLLTLLSACSSNPVPVIQTEYVEVELPPKLIPVSDDLTKPVPRQDIPQGITWRKLVELLMKDRASLEVANGQLEAIRERHGGER